MPAFRTKSPILCTEGAEPIAWWEAEQCEPPITLFPSSSFVQADWESAIPGLLHAFQNTLLERLKERSKLEILSQEILLLKDRVAQIETTTPAIVPIESLSPEPYCIYKTIHAVVRQQGNEYIATFYDANLSASGDTDTEAIYNLKDIIVGTFEILSSHERTDLAPGPARQLDVLESFIRIKS